MNAKNEAAFRKAKDFLKIGKPQQALPILEDLYAQVDENNVIATYAQTLYQAQQYIKAARVANDNQSCFLQKHDELFVQIMLAARLPLTARLFTAQLKDAKQAVLTKQIVEAEDNLKINSASTLRENARGFYHLGDLPVIQQRAQFIAAASLPLDEYLKGAKFVLRDPYVYPLIKSSIVRDLATLKVPDKMTIYWLDHEEHQFYPVKISATEQLKIVKEIRQSIKEAFANSDPQSFKLYSRNFDLQLMFLYPFVDLAIQDSNSWFAALTNNADAQGQNESQATKWQKLIERLAAKMLI